MTLVLETGAGVYNANSYVTSSFVTTYLTDRGRQAENSWSTATSAETDDACIAATDFIEKRFGLKFAGQRAYAFSNIYATADLVFTGLPSDTDTITIGQKTYTFVTTLTGEANEVLIGGTAAATAQNLVDAISADADTEGTSYGEDTVINRDVSATVDTATVTLTARAYGEGGNDTVLDGSPDNVTVGTFSGGQDSGPQPLSFPRCYLYGPDGRAVLGVPRALKHATAEYAVRAHAAALMPDLTLDASGGSVKRKRERVGPIEEETEYVEGTFLGLRIPPYPAADALLKQYLVGGGRGGVIR
jgi:hypothetical protein